MPTSPWAWLSMSARPDPNRARQEAAWRQSIGNAQLKCPTPRFQSTQQQPLAGARGLDGRFFNYCDSRSARPKLIQLPRPDPHAQAHGAILIFAVQHFGSILNRVNRLRI